MQNVLRLLLIIICFLFNIVTVKAEMSDYMPHKMIVQLEDDLSSECAPLTFKVIINDDYEIKNIGVVSKGTRLFLELLKISDPKRAKINATVEARIVKVYNPVTDATIVVKNPKAIVKLSKYEELDKANMATNIGITVANQFVKNITYPAHFVKGVAANKEGNRLKSGVKEVYSSSPISYIEKGEELNLQAGDLATLTYYTKNRLKN